MWKGVLTALPTPFEGGRLDERGFERIVRRQVEAGISALVPAGTTGESPLLEMDEHGALIGICREESRGRIPVVAGCGSNSTKKTVQLARNAERCGADGLLVVTPYYNRPPQEGLYRHFREVAESVELSLCLYNVPGRTGVNLMPETVARLSEIPNIAAIKEASGSLQQGCEILKRCGHDFHLLSGDDFTFLPLLSIGGKGIISVVSNILPEKMLLLYESYIRGDMEEAKGINLYLWDLYRAAFMDTNPVPVKTALSMMGLIREEFRLPLTGMNEEKKILLAETLKGYGLLS